METYENHENHRIPFEDNKTDENPKLLYENQENHEIKINRKRIIKLWKY